MSSLVQCTVHECGYGHDYDYGCRLVDIATMTTGYSCVVTFNIVFASIMSFILEIYDIIIVQSISVANSRSSVHAKAMHVA